MAAYILTWNIKDVNRRQTFVGVIQAFYNQTPKIIIGYCPIHYNAWAILTSKTAKELREMFSQYVLAEDSLLIIRSGVEAAWINSLGPANDEWLKNHL